MSTFINGVEFEICVTLANLRDIPNRSTFRAILRTDGLEKIILTCDPEVICGYSKLASLRTVAFCFDLPAPQFLKFISALEKRKKGGRPLSTLQINSLPKLILDCPGSLGRLSKSLPGIRKLFFDHSGPSEGVEMIRCEFGDKCIDI